MNRSSHKLIGLVLEFLSLQVAFRVKVMKDPQKIAEKELRGVLQPVS